MAAGSALQERQLAVFNPCRFEPAFTAFMSIAEDTGYTCGETIAEEEYLLFYRVCRFYDITSDLVCLRLQRKKRQICHANRHVEIQCVDGFQGTNPEVLKLECCFFTAEVTAAWEAVHPQVLR